MTKKGFFEATATAVASMLATILLTVVAEPVDATAAGESGRIAFVTQEWYPWWNSEIYTTTTDGTGLQKLTNDPRADAYPSWSPDGQKIAFASERGFDFGEIYVMNADGSGIQRLTNHPALDWYPSWSPNGERIAFLSHRDGNNEIYTVNVDGSGIQRLTNSTRNSTKEFRPAWSPDGERIAFTSDRDGNNEIYIVNVDGSGIQRLTNNPAVDECPSWSPDSERIAFTSDRDADDYSQIYVMSAGGSQMHRLTNAPGGASQPAWQPRDVRVDNAASRPTQTTLPLRAREVNPAAGVYATSSEAMTEAHIDTTASKPYNHGSSTSAAATDTYNLDTNEATLKPIKDLGISTPFEAGLAVSQYGELPP
jgi:dipeptidyl aminopeptidase/acylaminoacyl peptidase